MAERQLLEEGAGTTGDFAAEHSTQLHFDTTTLPTYASPAHSGTLSLYHVLHYIIRYAQLLSVVINYHCVIYARFATDPNPHPHTTTQEDSLVVHYSSRLVDNPGEIPEASPTVLLCLPSLAAYCTLRCWVLRTSTS